MLCASLQYLIKQRVFNISRAVKKQGIDDALIQPYSGHESRKSMEVYSKLAITDAQFENNEVINIFPI